MNSRRWSNVTKIIVVSGLALLTVGLLVTFRVMIAPTIVAFLLAFILSYPVNWIQQRTGWARGAIIALIYVLLLGLVALTPALFMSRALSLFDSLQAALDGLVTELDNPREIPLIGNLVLPVEDLLQNAASILSGVFSSINTNPFLLARGVTTGILTVIYVLVLNFWILKDLYQLQRFTLDLIPADYQEDMRRLGHELGAIWDAFLRGQLVLAIVVGIITWIALAMVGMPNAGGLALLAGFMEFLPTIGPGFSGTIGVSVALFSQSNWLPLEGWPFALLVLVIYAIIAQFETIHLIPRLVGRRVRLHPAVTFVGIISGAIVFGLLGVLLATPIMASARTILIYIRHKLRDLEPFEPAHAADSSVRIRGLLAGRKIEAVLFDLDGTLAELDLSLPQQVVERTQWMDRIVPSTQRRRIMYRIMIMLEGPINFLITQLMRLQLQKDLERIQPTLNRLRGYPPAEQLTALPDVDDVLHELQPNYRLGLISTRSQSTVEQFLANAHLENGLFRSVITREDVRNLVPHSEGLLKAASELHVEPSSLLVVSDTDMTLRSGRAASMATAGVLNGLGQERKLREDADLVLHNLGELCEWL